MTLVTPPETRKVQTYNDESWVNLVLDLLNKNKWVSDNKVISIQNVQSFPGSLLGT